MAVIVNLIQVKASAFSFRKSNFKLTWHLRQILFLKWK